jgi:molecular chaperone DnaJ
MATTERDYYELLGVSREASEAEIKRAFRKLARELHPDVSSAPDAERRFREVAEAFEVLSDPERRATYDRFGVAGLRRGGFEPTFADFGSLADVFAAFFGEDLFGGTRTRQRSTRGGDAHAAVEIDLEEAFSGVAVVVPVEVALACERCDATGAEPGTEARTCSTCSGSGMVRRVSQNVFGQFVQQRTCPECGGVGQVLETPCSECLGEGRLLATRQLEIDVPAGIHDGQTIRVRGEGHAGFQSRDRGNAFVTVRVRADPRFLRDGDDLHTAMRLTMTDAALGTIVRVPGLAGELELEIRPGAQPGEVRILQGQGMPSLNGSRRGDLYVRLDVAVPTQLTDVQRLLLEDFDREAGPETYSQGDDEDEGGFFRRLKSALR